MNTVNEATADHSAPSFLLPSRALVDEILGKNNGVIHLDNWDVATLLRFIATLHLTSKLPYGAIVRRLVDGGALKDKSTITTLWAREYSFC